MPMSPTWCWPHAFGQPEILISKRPSSATTSWPSCRVVPSSRCCSNPRRHPHALGDGERAVVGARAAHDVGDVQRVGLAEPDGHERTKERVELLRRDPAQDQVLLVGRANRPVAELSRKLGDGAKLLGRGVAERQLDGGHVVAGLRLRQARWSASSARRRRRRSARPARRAAAPARGTRRGSRPAIRAARRRARRGRPRAQRRGAARTPLRRARGARTSSGSFCGSCARRRESTRARWPRTRASRSDSGTKSSQACAISGVEPRPPAT